MLWCGAVKNGFRMLTRVITRGSAALSSVLSAASQLMSAAGKLLSNMWGYGCRVVSNGFRLIARGSSALSCTVHYGVRQTIRFLSGGGAALSSVLSAAGKLLSNIKLSRSRANPSARTSSQGDDSLSSEASGDVVTCHIVPHSLDTKVSSNRQRSAGDRHDRSGRSLSLRS